MSLPVSYLYAWYIKIVMQKLSNFFSRWFWSILLDIHRKNLIYSDNWSFLQLQFCKNEINRRKFSYFSVNLNLFQLRDTNHWIFRYKLKNVSLEIRIFLVKKGVFFTLFLTRKSTSFLTYFFTLIIIFLNFIF